MSSRVSQHFFESPPSLLWFKRDLRVEDHLPLLKARENGPLIGVFIIEEEWKTCPHFSSFHLQFVLDSLIDLQKNLNKRGIPLFIKEGEALSVLKSLHEEFQFSKLFSHQETGLHWTYKRDLRVQSWCKNQGILWDETRPFAVFRGLKNRDLWNRKRKEFASRALYAPVRGQNRKYLKIQSYLATKLREEMRENRFLQRGGEEAAHECLESFLDSRGKFYNRHMSIPLKSFDESSRLSPYLTYGNLSLVQVNRALISARERKKQESSADWTQWRRSLKSFENRLWWHCHFIQKLERSPEIEFQNMNHGFDGMREEEFREDLFSAWTAGETGYPLIDASMRALQKYGWIHFRLRAMLVSFASYHLWLHWKKPAEYLARVFIDFEPGIHYSQIQMQSGVTGINTIRIYSPIRPGKDQASTHKFIRSFCPELSQVDDRYLLEPHLTPPLLQQMLPIKPGNSYPLPIVDHLEAYHHAKERVFSWKERELVRQEAREVYLKHGSRKNAFFPNQKRDTVTKEPLLL